MGEAGIAVVVPSFRAKRTLRRSVESVARDARAIVVFDGLDVAAEGAIADLPVEMLRMPAGSGASACRNAGLAQIEAPYVLFLDSDDYIEGPLLQAACRTAANSLYVLSVATQFMTNCTKNYTFGALRWKTWIY